MGSQMSTLRLDSRVFGFGFLELTECKAQILLKPNS